MTSQLYYVGGGQGEGLKSKIETWTDSVLRDATEHVPLGPPVWGATPPPGSASLGFGGIFDTTPPTQANVVGEHHVGFLVSPPGLPARSSNQVLTITGQIHCRDGSQVEWQPILDARGDAVSLLVIVHLYGDQLQQIPPPQRRTMTYTIPELVAEYPSAMRSVDPTKLLEAFLIGLEIDDCEYDPMSFIPSGGGPLDLDPLGLISVPVGTLPSQPDAGVVIDPEMPYPICGWFNLYWGPAFEVQQGGQRSDTGTLLQQRSSRHARVGRPTAASPQRSRRLKG